MRRLALLLGLLLIAIPAHADEDPGAVLLESGAVFVEAAVEPAAGAVVSQRISLNLTLGTRNWFSGAPTLPDPEIEGALVRRFGNQAVNASESRNGETYAVQTWTWWIYPRRAGSFEIPALDVVLRTVDDERNKVQVEARTKPLRFEVSLPAEATGDEMLSTHRFVLEQTLDPTPEGLKVGDALRRTLTMRADDVPGMLIPPVSLNAPDGLRAYPDPPRIDDEYDRGTLAGLRVQSTSYILEREGEYVLPEAGVRWWNLESQAWEETVAESVSFTVAPNPDAVLGSATSEGELGETGPARRAASTWRIVSVLIGLLVLGFLAAIVARRLPAWRVARIAARRRHWESEPEAFKRFQAACRTDDPRGAASALRAWLDRSAGPDVTVEAFADQAGDEALTRETASLSATLYGADASRAWAGAGLANAVSHARALTLSDDRPAPDARRPLNPRGPLTRR